MINTKTIKQTSKSYFKIILMITIKEKWWIFVSLWLLAIINIVFPKDNSISYFIIPFAIVYPIVYLIYLYWFAHSSDNKLFFIDRYLEIDEDKMICFLSDGTENALKIEYFVRVIEMKKYYLLYISKMQFVYIPKDCFKSEEDKMWFEKTILAKIKG